MFNLHKKKNEGKILATVILLTWAFSSQICTSLDKEVNPNDNIVVVVNGREIKYREIDRREYTLSIYEMKNERLPKGYKLNEAILKNEKEALVGIIHDIVKKQKLVELGIKVSEEEIDKEIQNILSKISPEEIQKANRKMLALTKALEEALENPNKEKEIYGKSLSTLMSYEEWKTYRTQINNMAKLDLLKKEFPITIEKEKQKIHRQDMKSLLLDRKLGQYITKNVSVTDEELKKFIQEEKHIKIKNEDQYKKLKDVFRGELSERKKREKLSEWWQSVYEEAHIEIKDPRFENVIYSFKKGVKPEE